MEGAGFEYLTATSSEVGGAAGNSGSPPLRQQAARQALAANAAEAGARGSPTGIAPGDYLGGGHSPNLVVRKTFLEVDSTPVKKDWWRRQHSEPAQLLNGKDIPEEDSLSELSEDDENIINDPPSPRPTMAAAADSTLGATVPPFGMEAIGAAGGFGAGGDAHGSYGLPRPDQLYGQSGAGEDWDYGDDEAPKVLLLSESIPVRKARAQDLQKKEQYVVRDISLTKQEPPWAEVTTVMMRNLPNKYTQQMLLEELQDAGFRLKQAIDFFYLPMDHSNAANLGYCFINFVSTNIANAFAAAFGGNKMRRFNSNKTVVVMPASIQGFDKNFAYYASTRVVQAEDPAYRPLFVRAPSGKGNPGPPSPRGPGGVPGGRGSQMGGGGPGPVGKGRPLNQDVDGAGYPHANYHYRGGEGGAADYSRPEPGGVDYYNGGGHFMEVAREAERRLAASRPGGPYEDFGSAPPRPPVPMPMPESLPPAPSRPKAPNFCPFCGGPIRNLFQFCPNCGASLDLSMGTLDNASLRADAPAFVPVPEAVHAPPVAPPAPPPPPPRLSSLPGGAGGGMGGGQMHALGALLGQDAGGLGGGLLGGNGFGRPGGGSDNFQFSSEVTDELDVMRGRMMLLAALKEMEKRDDPGGDGLANVLAMGLGGGGGGGRPGGW